jgi:hypothetical protein
MEKKHGYGFWVKFLDETYQTTFVQIDSFCNCNRLNLKGKKEKNPDLQTLFFGLET